MPITTLSLSRYKRRIFIETGTYIGDGVASALAAGFEEAWTIELQQDRYEAAARRFALDGRVHVVFGDTIAKLPEILARVNEPATIWLDAHGNPYLPLAEELDAIKQHGRSDHVILIDDIWATDTEVQEKHNLRGRLLGINPNYKLYFIDGQTDGLTASGVPHAPIPQSILVAEPV